MRNTIVLVRTDNFQKASVALADLVRYGGMEIRGDPRIIPPALSDWAFEKISGEKPRRKFRAHVIAQVDLPPAKAIGRLTDIHPPPTSSSSPRFRGLGGAHTPLEHVREAERFPPAKRRKGEGGGKKEGEGEF